jgi:hypothetical protein
MTLMVRNHEHEPLFIGMMQDVGNVDLSSSTAIGTLVVVEGSGHGGFGQFSVRRNVDHAKHIEREDRAAAAGVMDELSVGLPRSPFI